MVSKPPQIANSTVHPYSYRALFSNYVDSVEQIKFQQVISQSAGYLMIEGAKLKYGKPYESLSASEKHVMEQYINMLGLRTEIRTTSVVNPNTGKMEEHHQVTFVNNLVDGSK